MNDEQVCRVVKSCRDIQESYFSLLSLALSVNNSYGLQQKIQEAFAGQHVINLGAGMFWKRDARALLGMSNHFKFPLNASFVTAVDPFFDAEEGEQMRMVQQDGLSYLRKQPSNSANIIMSGLDLFIIPSQQYLDKLVREAYRVVPDNGFLYTNTYDTKPIAARVFDEEFELGMFQKQGSSP